MALRAPAGIVAPEATPVPSGFTLDADGARSAAVAFSRFGGALVAMADADAIAARRAMASAATAELQADEFATALNRLRERWPAGSLSYQVTPLATRVRPAQTAMRVEVWYVGVVAARGTATYAEWVTDTYELVPEQGQWRVASLVEAHGPTPAPGPHPVASPAELEARLAGFEPVA
ncbi:MAG: hypothetical protein AB1673_16490 [Actinomycetota bacterium]